MKADVVILGAVALVTAFFFWNTASVTAKYADPATINSPIVPKSIIQAIIEKIQSGSPWLQPINTVFINPLTTPQGGTEYSARFMFLDTRGFFGNQFDVTASVSPDGGVNIIKQVTTSTPSAIGPFDAFTADKYQSYSDVNTSLSLQLRQALQQTRQLPGETKVLA
jgi:hypothetical protein